jgi:serine palmitoyltransferase
VGATIPNWCFEHTALHQSTLSIVHGAQKEHQRRSLSLTPRSTEDPEGNAQQLPAMAAGAQQFYIRNLYGNIEDTFNRPIESSPDGWIDVALRERESTGGFFSKLRCAPPSSLRNREGLDLDSELTRFSGQWS